MASEDRTIATNTKGSSQPVTWHPLFPALVAIWFGALFGLGALAVRTALVEALVLSSGIEGVLPAAAPPLGTTARILVAVAFAVIGGAIGAMLGTLLARSKPSAKRRRADAAARAAQSKAAQAEAAELAADRATAQTDFGKAPNFIDISQLDLAEELRIEPGELDAPASDGAEIAGASAEAATPARTGDRPLDPVSFPLPASFPAPGGKAAARLTAATLDSLSHVELIERLALSLQKRREQAGAAAAQEQTAADDPMAEPPAGRPAPDFEMPQAPSYYPSAPQAAQARLASISARHDSYDDGRPGDAKPVPLFPEPAAAPLAALRHDSVATERALRDALATLQRMSGAA